MDGEDFGKGHSLDPSTLDHIIRKLKNKKASGVEKGSNTVIKILRNTNENLLPLLFALPRL